MIIFFGLVFLLAQGCTGIIEDMIGTGSDNERVVDSRIIIAVRQIIQTMRPEFRSYESFRKKFQNDRRYISPRETKQPRDVYVRNDIDPRENRGYVEYRRQENVDGYQVNTGNPDGVVIEGDRYTGEYREYERVPQSEPVWDKAETTSPGPIQVEPEKPTGESSVNEPASSLPPGKKNADKRVRDGNWEITYPQGSINTPSLNEIRTKQASPVNRNARPVDTNPPETTEPKPEPRVKWVQNENRFRTYIGERKIKLGFLEIADIYRVTSNVMCKYFTEKVLNFTFLDEGIRRNFSMIDSISQGEVEKNYNEDYLGGYTREEFEQLKKGNPELSLEILREIAKKKSSMERTWNKMHPTEYDLQAVAILLGAKYNLDVIETGFFVDAADSIDLNLRMIETRHGEVVAVGSVKIPKKFLPAKWLHDKYGERNILKE